MLQGPVEELAPTLKTDAVYLDPPYTKRQYAGNYHVLETLACEDEPVAAGDGGLRPWTDQASDFCYRRSAGQAFRETLKRLDVPHVFISYSEDGQVGEDELALDSERLRQGHAPRTASYSIQKQRSCERLDQCLSVSTT